MLGVHGTGEYQTEELWGNYTLLSTVDGILLVGASWAVTNIHLDEMRVAGGPQLAEPWVQFEASWSSVIGYGGALPVILVLEMQRQEGEKPKVILVYITYPRRPS